MFCFPSTWTTGTYIEKVQGKYREILHQYTDQVHSLLMYLKAVHETKLGYPSKDFILPN